MSVVIQRTQPVLDLSFSVVEQLARTKRAEVIVPLDIEAISIAADLDNLIYSLYPHTNYQMYLNGSEISRPDRYPRSSSSCNIKYFLQKANFEHIDPREFSSFPDRTWIKHAESGESNIVVGARSPTFPDDRKSRLLKDLLHNGYFMPRENMFVMEFTYEFPLGLEVTMPYQELLSKGILRRGSRFVDIYPVSTLSDAVLDEDVFRFFSDPITWNNRSNSCVTAFNHMTGKEKYDNIHAGKYTEKVVEAAKALEISVVEIIESALRSGTDYIKTSRCSPQYTGIYLGKIVGSIRALCNQKANIDGRRSYLENLASSCRGYGLNVTSVQLAGMKRK